MGNQTVTQAALTDQNSVRPHQTVEKIALFDPVSGDPLVVPQDSTDLTYPVITVGTAIGTAAKTTSSSVPTTNSVVAIKFTNGNSANSPTVAFNGGAAKSILLGGTAVTGAKLAVAANGVALFFYDGTSLHQIGAYT